MKTLEQRFNEKWIPVPESGCWIWVAALQSSGYGQIKKPQDRGNVGAHRVSYELYVGEIPKGFDVCHKCDNKLCVNPDHLFAGSRSENIQDCVNKGRQTQVRRGEDNSRSKLSNSNVIEIRKSSKSNRVLAKEYGVSSTTICHIKNMKMWRHL